MVQIHEDVDGCGCLRCQEVDQQVLQRSLPGVFYWSIMLPLARPSILLVLGIVGLLQLAILIAPSALSVLLVTLGVFGVFVGRGYIGIVGRETLGDSSSTPGTALRQVFGQLSAFTGALTAIVVWLFVATVIVARVVSPGIQWVTATIGYEPAFVEFVPLLVLVLVILYTLLKCCFVPEACFVGGYGPLESLRVSWQITSAHTAKILLILAGFALLLAVGVALDTQFTGAGAPVALSFELGDTTIVLRSFGLSLGSGVRFGFDLAVTALYSGMFVHQYVDSTISFSSE